MRSKHTAMACKLLKSTQFFVNCILSLEKLFARYVDEKLEFWIVFSWFLVYATDVRTQTRPQTQMDYQTDLIFEPHLLMVYHQVWCSAIKWSL